MEAATTAFLVTVAIIGGILAPIAIFYILGLFGIALKALGQYLENQSEKIKKLPPYDDVELNMNPATKVLTTRLYRNGKIIYQGSVSQNELRDADQGDPIHFRKDAE